MSGKEKRMKDLSKKNEYYLPKERRLELEHFVKQYPMWKTIERNIGMGLDVGTHLGVNFSKDWIDYTGDKATLRVMIQGKISKVDQALAIFDGEPDLQNYIYENVIYGHSYDTLAAYKFAVMPVSRHEFYRQVRRFYFKLNSIVK